jgi:Arc/MetJ-type ribon-helix-helix transcriptional regulator
MPITTFDIEQEFYDDIKQIVETDKLEYPNMANFINKAIRDKLKQIKKR